MLSRGKQEVLKSRSQARGVLHATSEALVQALAFRKWDVFGSAQSLRAQKSL